jgi:hypothetical protein
MTDDERRAAILGEEDPEQLVHLVYEHYRDRDRADATSRELMYLHLGLLSGHIMRQATELRLLQAKGGPPSSNAVRED